MDEQVQQVLNYHQRSKHSLKAYARGPEFIDWEQQPDPFRRFSGAPLIELPLLAADEEPAAAQGLDLISVATLLQLSMGLSAWKQFGPDRWALRCNPSSGNLHPTETYLITHSVQGLDDGLYHYAVHEHALEQRASLESSAQDTQLLIGFSSIAWREAWKYGERAFRYVQLDLGHACAALIYATGLLGLELTLLPYSDNRIENLLGLDRDADFSDAENEQADLMFSVGRSGDVDMQPQQLTDWQGSANSLGGEPYHRWKAIEQVAGATYSNGFSRYPSDAVKETNEILKPDNLAGLIRQRRSAQAFDPRSSTLPLQEFIQILQALVPEHNRPPWNNWPISPSLHLILFVHRVEGLQPGLYLLPRTESFRQTAKPLMNGEFEWRRVDSMPESVPLYRLLPGDARKTARTLGCHQEIASSGAFSLAMLAEFDKALQQHGAAAYRPLYWEAGVIGQVLYLQAEAAGMNGTGIGCFFDDSVHQLLGLEGTELQALYHFTVGKAKVDNRLITLPPYQHLERG